MRILALDAALGPCSAALVWDGTVLAEAKSGDPRGASAALPGLVQAVLAGPGAPGFDAVAVTVGPGSFTGIRAALALAHGLAIGAGVPVIGVTSLAAFEAAWTKVAGQTLWVAIDTRRGGVFLARDGAIIALAMDALPQAGPGVVLAGDAAMAAAAQCGGAFTGLDRIEARHVAAAAAGGHRVEPQPLYIVAPEARAQAARPAPV